jgi:hypothetical protein
MIYDKARMAKLSGLMTESSHKGIKNSMAKHFGGGKEEGEPWLDGEVTTEGTYDEDDNESIMRTEGEDGMDHEPMEARRKKGDDDEEKAVREMIRTELRKAKKDADVEKKEENAVREAVRKEIRSVLKSRGVAIGGTGVGFKR